MVIKVSSKKCSCLSIGKKKSLCEYLVSSHIIEQVDSIKKNIGVTIDSNQTFNEHLAEKTCLPPPGLEPGSSNCRSGALPTKLQSETSFHRLCCAFIVSVSLQAHQY